MVPGRVMVQAPDLIQALLELGACSSGDLDEAQARQLIYGGDLELNLMELQVVREADLLRALAHVTQGPVAPPGPLAVERATSARIREIAPDGVAGFAADGPVLISLAGPPTEAQRHALIEACGGRRVVVQFTTTLRVLEALALLDDTPLDPRILQQLKQTGDLLTELQPAAPPLSLPVQATPAPLPAVPPPVAEQPPTDSSLSELSRFVSKDGPTLSAAQRHVAVTSVATPAPESKA